MLKAIIGYQAAEVAEAGHIYLTRLGALCARLCINQLNISIFTNSISLAHASNKVDTAC
jgi:hypothetical protein